MMDGCVPCAAPPRLARPVAAAPPPARAQPPARAWQPPDQASPWPQSLPPPVPPPPQEYYGQQVQQIPLVHDKGAFGGGVSNASLAQGGPSADPSATSTDVVIVRFKRSWSIQDALDQHSTLCRQKDSLAKIRENRLRVRQSQLEFARFEVESALARTRSATTAELGDTQKTQALALHVRRVTLDLASAIRLKRIDDAVLKNHTGLAEAEVAESRLEMTDLKAAVDDKSLVVATDDGTLLSPAVTPEERQYLYCTNCKVGGHGQRFCEYLLKRPEWRVYPCQKWFEDETKRNEYHCPLGKRLVDFADESHFSRVAMYIKGRVWLEDKTKMWDLVPELMPETYIIQDRQWRDSTAPPMDDGDLDLPWFVKGADRNWGTSVHVCAAAQQCMDFAKPDTVYVVQQHIRDPLLMEDGRKCHIKFYVLLMSLEDAVTWRLYTFTDGYLSISPHRWSPNDLSNETQVTIIRSERIQGWKPWPEAYPKCKAAVAEVIRRGVARGKLEGRTGKRQFEILSADFIVDTRGDVWLLEFNMSPVLKDTQDSPTTNDADMITAALDIVLPPRGQGASPGNWDLAGEFIGEPPPPQEPKAGPPAPVPNDAGAPAGGSAAMEGAAPPALMPNDAGAPAGGNAAVEGAAPPAPMPNDASALTGGGAVVEEATATVGEQAQAGKEPYADASADTAALGAAGAAAESAPSQAQTSVPEAQARHAQRQGNAATSEGAGAAQVW